MIARFRSWWEQIKQRRVTIGIVAIVLVVVIALIIAGYWFDWTGFDGYNKVTIARTTSGPSAGTVVRTEVYQPGKALWDWLQLLIIPAVLVVGGFLLNYTTSRNEQAISSDNQREAAMKEYFDKVSELMLHENLSKSAPDAEVRKIARVLTLTVLPRLDGRRKGRVLQFLYESGLIIKGQSIIDLKGADLKDADLLGAKLSGADLSGVFLREANLFQANLNGANLILTALTAAILFKADLSAANLEKAFLDGGTDLRFANLNGANLQETKLKGTNLQGANVTSTQLDKAIFYEGVTMPDGTQHA